MVLNNWSYEMRDIASYPAYVKNPFLSPLANAVTAANFDLIGKIKPGDRVLEVGCGISSYIRDNMPEYTFWEGIDVFERDSRGRTCIATRLGSVHSIPFKSDWFNFVVSNQSIEHWFEYGVSIERGLKEIARVLKVKGKLHINFPFHLHGHPLFVTGDIDSILALFKQSIWQINNVIAYIDSVEPDYHGWNHSKFPYSYVSTIREVNTSYVVNIISEKITSRFDEHVENPDKRPLILPRRKSLLGRSIKHGLRVTTWKIMRKIFRLLHS